MNNNDTTSNTTTAAANDETQINLRGGAGGRATAGYNTQHYKYCLLQESNFCKAMMIMLQGQKLVMQKFEANESECDGTLLHACTEHHLM